MGLTYVPRNFPLGGRPKHCNATAPNDSGYRRARNCASVVRKLCHHGTSIILKPKIIELTFYDQEWWTHLWLNEGYATFSESLCVDRIFPEFQIWTQFVTDTSIPAMDLDSLKNSHPIEVPIGNPNEIDEIFDDISYHKGAAIIRMLHNYIGDDVN